MKIFFDKLRSFEIPDKYDRWKIISSKYDFENHFKNAFFKLKRNSEMFKSFKQHDFEKYKLAVKEFYKEVEYLL